MTTALQHRTVLLDEAVNALVWRPDGSYVDATFGRGGHSRAILERLGADGRLLALDRDPAAAEAARAVADPRFHFEQAPFAELRAVLERRCAGQGCDGVLLDIGVSSPQLDDPARGFSFGKDGPLDMRMDPGAGVSAADWIALAEEAEISRVLRDLGEERFHRRIAAAIVRRREEQPFVTTADLAAVVAAAVPTRERGKNPATRSFQALRIHLNDELGQLERVLPQAVDVLVPGGRLVVISFHSLEDRIVKRFMRDAARGRELPPDLPVTHAAEGATLRLVGRAVRAGEAEVDANPRARSAVMRVAERLA